MDVCRACCVLSGRGLCEELITRPEESYRLWCVVECDLETSCPLGGLSRQKQTPITKLSARRHPEFTDQYQIFGLQSAVGKADTKFYVVTERVILEDIFFPKYFYRDVASSLKRFRRFFSRRHNGLCAQGRTAG
jgi:hypothetical protein